MGQIIAIALQRNEYECHPFTDPAAALAHIETNATDVVITDLKMPDIDGLEVLSRVRQGSDPPPVILITAHGTVANAVAAMRDGAFDYVTKPFDNDELRAIVGRAAEVHRLRKENRNLRKDVGERYAPSSIVAESPPMRELLEILQRVAPSKATVLVQGESGTGKELVARLLHYWSNRVGEPFVAVNCKAFAEGVLESELFGHSKGAFTGATADRRGCFERAAEGTLFLDEIGEVSPDFQAKLLRVLQDREVLPVGAEQPRPMRARVVAATNRDLRAEVSSGNFREDLFFRLNVIPVQIAPLRERPADILPLAEFFLASYCRAEGRDLSFTGECIATLQQQRWSGNVRELENAIERAVVLATGTQIEAHDLMITPPASAQESSGGGVTLREHLDRETAGQVRQALAATNGNRGDAAEILGIERTTLYRLMRKHGID